MLSIIPVLSRFQGGCRREWFRAKDDRNKMETGCQVFLLILVNPWTQVRRCFSAKAVEAPILFVCLFLHIIVVWGGGDTFSTPLTLSQQEKNSNSTK
jgi:hypothetical protein